MASSAIISRLVDDFFRAAYGSHRLPSVATFTCTSYMCLLAFINLVDVECLGTESGSD